MKRCSHCRHWDEIGGRSGLCYINGALVKSTRTGRVGWRRVLTFFYEVCTEFKRKER